jgi:hypothetical protein
MYRDDETRRFDEVEARLTTAEKAVAAGTSGRRWLSIGLIALVAGTTFGHATQARQLAETEAAVGLCDDGEAAEAIEERHRLTRQQDGDLCTATCMSLMRIEDITAAGRLSSTCSWEPDGVRSCACSCSIARDGVGRLQISTVGVTESR